jgi:DNA-binding response OmpR family regulator
VSEQVTVGQIRLNRLTRRVTTPKGALDLTPMELRLLEHMMLHAGELVTRGDLHDKVWDMHFDPSSNLVDAHIARLRKKLYGAQAGVTLMTRRGMGFMLQASVPGEEESAHDECGVSIAHA